MVVPTGPTDRRARLLTRPRAGQTPKLAPGRTARVTVVGGGLAGVSAALVLAERGVKVTLHESDPVLGGRLSSWPDTCAPANSKSRRTASSSDFLASV